MRRRTFLSYSVALAASSALNPGRAFATATSRDWAALRQKVGSRLIETPSALLQLAQTGGVGADQLLPRLKNPYLLSDTPGLTQTFGWVDAWTSRPSLKAVAAESAQDVAAAIEFAARSGIPPVVKGGGHSYFGNSNRAGSLLIWTKKMRSIEVHDAFRAAGAPADTAPVPAVSVGAGCLWGEVYATCAVKHGRYVQGGGCLTVGVAGLVHGGGFGSFSKQFGTGAANLLEAELVTADGKVRTVNRWTEPDLFFALRGGGGGTFGVTTRLTLRTHDLPQAAGAVLLDIKARDEPGFESLVAEMMRFYAKKLFNPAWGEQIRFSRLRLRTNLLCHGLTEKQIRSMWAPFLQWVRERPSSYEFGEDPQFITIPFRQMWDPEALVEIPGIVGRDDRPGAPASNVYWVGDLAEAGQTLQAYQSAWMPSALLSEAGRSKLVNALVRASNHWTVTLHTNKGLAGGSPGALALTRETATNPGVLDAFALLICASEQVEPVYPGIPGHEPDVVEARSAAAGVRRAMAEIYKIAPHAGAYMSECDYFLKDWKQAQWGRHYPKLAATKRRYDPDGLFTGHHCVEQS
jgi:FAD/FMN-containing dehydrogenase